MRSRAKRRYRSMDALPRTRERFLPRHEHHEHVVAELALEGRDVLEPGWEHTRVGVLIVECAEAGLFRACDERRV